MSYIDEIIRQTEIDKKFVEDYDKKHTLRKRIGNSAFAGAISSFFSRLSGLFFLSYDNKTFGLGDSIFVASTINLICGFITAGIFYMGFYYDNLPLFLGISFLHFILVNVCLYKYEGIVLHLLMYFGLIFWLNSRIYTDIKEIGIIPELKKEIVDNNIENHIEFFDYQINKVFKNKK